MQIRIKETELFDGSKVHDINIPCNSNPAFGHKVIISCVSELDAHEFAFQLKALIDKHTVELVEIISRVT